MLTWFTNSRMLITIYMLVKSKREVASLHDKGMLTSGIILPSALSSQPTKKKKKALASVVSRLFGRSRCSLILNLQQFWYRVPVLAVHTQWKWKLVLCIDILMVDNVCFLEHMTRQKGLRTGKNAQPSALRWCPLLVHRFCSVLCVLVCGYPPSWCMVFRYVC